MKRIIIGSKNGNWTPTAGDVREILDAHVDDGVTSPSIERINEALAKAAPSNAQFHNGGWQGNSEWIADDPYIRVRVQHRTGGDLYAPIGLTWLLDIHDDALLLETKVAVCGFRETKQVEVVNLKVVVRHPRHMTYDDALMKAAEGALHFEIEDEEVNENETRAFNSRNTDEPVLEIDWATAEQEEN